MHQHGCGGRRWLERPPGSRRCQKGLHEARLEPRNSARTLRCGTDIVLAGPFLGLGEVNVQREQWTAAQAALDRGISKGQLKDAGNAQLLMGIVLFNQKKYAEAKPWFERASQSEKHRQMSRGYLQLIQANA